MPTRDEWPAEQQGDEYVPNGAPVPRPVAGTRSKAEDLIKKQLSEVESCSHDELLMANLPPLSWIVDGLIPDESLTFLGGRKKLGKSWLCLQIAQTVALGQECLGKTTVQGSVVYLCLEDGKRRLKGRLQKQQAPGNLPIHYYTRFPGLDGDGTGLLLELVEERRPKLLMLDTLAAAKSGKIDENAAGPLADIANFLRAVAQRYTLGILVTHHHGKFVIGDPGSDLRGTSALGGAADVNLGLYREEGRYILRGEGRDIQEFSMNLKFDPVETWCWQLTADQPASGERESEREVLEALEALGESSLQGLADYTGKSYDAIRRIIRKLVVQRIICSHEERAEKRGRPRVVFSFPEPDSADEDAQRSIFGAPAAP